MLFPEDAVFGFVLIDLAATLRGYLTPAANPLPCDPYIARSALQKSVRRGDVATAHRALATLLANDRAATWRHLVVIALEDIGIANIDLLARVVAARLDRTWRNQMGGDWPVLAGLVRQMAESDHCQAVCDLLLQATIAPIWAAERETAMVANKSQLGCRIRDLAQPIEHRGIAVLAIGGGLVEHQASTDPTRVFSILGSAGCASHILTTCQAAWRASRNPMALLLPLLWQRWVDAGQSAVADDKFTTGPNFDGVPGCAIDQFTRVGGAVARAYIAGSPAMGKLMDGVAIPPGRRPRAVGDLFFLIEGSALLRRMIWTEGDRLRLPNRMLATVPLWGSGLAEALALVRSQGDFIADLRRLHFHRAQQQ